MKKFSVLVLAILLFCGVSIAAAQETVPYQGKFFPYPSSQRIDGDLWVKGTVYYGTAKTDWVQWYPAIQYCSSDSTNLIKTRVAQFDWALARTAGAGETYNIICTLDLPTRTATSSGAKLTAIDLVYQITTQNLTSHTFGGIRSVVYANNAANVIAAFGGSITGPTMATATQTNPYLYTASFGTPAFVNAADKAILVEWTAVMQNLGIYRVYGVAAKFTQAE